MSLTVKLPGSEVTNPFYGLYVNGHNATICIFGAHAAQADACLTIGILVTAKIKETGE
jgi:hypothetical protein